MSTISSKEFFGSSTKPTNPLDSFSAMDKQETEKTRGQKFVEGVSSSLENRLNNVSSAQSKAIKGEQNPLSAVLQTAGQTAGFIGDVGFEAAKAVIPESIKAPIRSGIQAVAGSAPVQETAKQYEAWKTANPETAANLESAVNIASILPAGGLGLKTLEKGTEIASPLIKEGIQETKNIASDTVSAAGKMARGAEDIAVKMTAPSVPKQVTTALRETQAPKLDEIINITKKANESYKNPTALEAVGGRAESAVEALKGKLTQLGTQKEEIMKIGGGSVTPFKGDGITKFNEALQSFKNSRTSVEGDSKLIRDIESEFKKLGKTPSAGQVDRFIDFAQSKLYTSGKELTVPVTDVATARIRAMLGKLNSDLKDQLPPTYGKVNDEYSRVKAIMDELNTKLGKEGERAGSLMKRVFSPSDANTKKLFAEVQKETGIDLITEATIARYVMDTMGDSRQASMLEQLKLPPTSKAGIFQYLKDIISAKVSTPEKILERARRETIGGKEESIQQGPKSNIGLGLSMKNVGPKTELEKLKRPNDPNFQVTKTGKTFENKPVFSLSTDSILARDTSGYGELDETQVRNYMRQYETTGEVEPIKVIVGDGNIFTEDGKHRLEALRRLGAGYVDVVDVTPQTLQKVSAHTKLDGAINVKDYTRVKTSTPKIEGFQNFNDLSTKLLGRLQGKTTVSKQFISDLTNSPDLKQPEKELFRELLKGEGNTVNVTDFANKVKSELLPLKVRSDKGARYESISLPDELRGPVANYQERIYESPIKTSAGDVHFGFAAQGGKPDSYFAHTRIEDLPDKKTRRVIEAQSDLFQKGGLDNEKAWDRVVNDPRAKAFFKERLGDRPWEKLRNMKGYDNYGGQGDFLKYIETENPKLYREIEDDISKSLSKLQPYRNTWHERVIREEVKQAAKDGKTKLQFPTGETAMKIEGLGQNDNWFIDPNLSIDDRIRMTPSQFLRANKQKLTPDTLKVGTVVHNGTPNDAWIITDVLGDGKFKAVPKDVWDKVKNKEAGYSTPISIDRASETFDISGKVDTNNPIYKFYEKEVARYLKNKYNAQLITDPRGVKWMEVKITPDMKKLPIEAFGVVGGIGIGTQATSD